MSSFRIITAAVEIDDDSELRYPGTALLRAEQALKSAGFKVGTIRNAPGDSDDLPPANAEAVTA